MVAASTKWFVVLAAFITMYCIIVNVSAAKESVERMTAMGLPIAVLFFTLFAWAPLQNTLDGAVYDAADGVWTVSDFGAEDSLNNIKSAIGQTGDTGHIWMNPFLLYVSAINNIYYKIAADAAQYEQKNDSSKFSIWKLITDSGFTLIQGLLYIVYKLLSWVILTLAFFIGFILNVLVALTMGVRMMFLTFAPIFALFFIPNMLNPGMRDLGKRFLMQSFFPILLYPLALSLSLWIVRALSFIAILGLMNTETSCNYQQVINFMTGQQSGGTSTQGTGISLMMLGVGTIVGLVAFWYITKFHFWAVKKSIQNVQALFGGDATGFFDVNGQSSAESVGNGMKESGSRAGKGAVQGAVQGAAAGPKGAVIGAVKGAGSSLIK